jgi:hypothetical protein
LPPSCSESAEKALTEIVGNSTCGIGATGSWKNASAPARVIASARSVVATGRATNGAERFTAETRPQPARRSRARHGAS